MEAMDEDQLASSLTTGLLNLHSMSEPRSSALFDQLRAEVAAYCATGSVVPLGEEHAPPPTLPNPTLFRSPSEYDLHYGANPFGAFPLFAAEYAGPRPFAALCLRELEAWLAELKARTVAHEAVADEAVVAADTTVCFADEIFGKPADKADFLRMMRVLSGQTHQVYTGVCVVRSQRVQSTVVCTDVTLRVMSETECNAYWATGEPCDKAGGYGIQGLAARFVRQIHGSYTNVVGLPLVELEALLHDAS